MPITALIVDDEPLARKRMRRLLLHAASGPTMIGKAANRGEAWRLVAEQAPRVVFLDVQMPRLDGFERRDTRPASHRDHVVVLHDGTQLQWSGAYRERLDRSRQ